MEFPKEVMTKSQLVKMGISKIWLESLTHMPNKICFQLGSAKNSPFYYDTVELGKYIERHKGYR